MLKRANDKQGFVGLEVCSDPMRLFRVSGLHTLDEATMLGMLLDMKAYIKGQGVMESYHQKGCEALRVLSSRRKTAGG